MEAGNETAGPWCSPTAWLKPICCPTRGYLFRLCLPLYNRDAGSIFPLRVGE